MSSFDDNDRILVIEGVVKPTTSINELQRSVDCRYLLSLNDEQGISNTYRLHDLIKVDSSWIAALAIPCGYYITRLSENQYRLYHHERRIESDSAIISHKVFPWLNRYKIITDYKNTRKSQFLEYNLACGELEEEFHFTHDLNGNTYKFDANDSLLSITRPQY